MDRRLEAALRWGFLRQPENDMGTNTKAVLNYGDGKSVEIGVAGGTYASGEPTITLELGEPLTLRNTADGSRFELELLAVAGFPLPKPSR